jgi:hypothetical protein
VRDHSVAQERSRHPERQMLLLVANLPISEAALP